MADDNLQLTDLELESLNGILQTTVNEKSEKGPGSIKHGIGKGKKMTKRTSTVLHKNGSPDKKKTKLPNDSDTSKESEFKTSDSQNQFWERAIALATSNAVHVHYHFHYNHTQ